MEREKPYLSKKSTGLSWDWWKESPIEIILVVFILVLFLVPRQGCGITPKDQTASVQPAANVEQPVQNAEND